MTPIYAAVILLIIDAWNHNTTALPFADMAKCRTAEKEIRARQAGADKWMKFYCLETGYSNPAPGARPL